MSFRIEFEAIFREFFQPKDFYCPLRLVSDKLDNGSTWDGKNCNEYVLLNIEKLVLFLELQDKQDTQVPSLEIHANRPSSTPCCLQMFGCLYSRARLG